MRCKHTSGSRIRAVAWELGCSMFTNCSPLIALLLVAIVFIRNLNKVASLNSFVIERVESMFARSENYA